jgi:hypothetical protein
LSAGIKANVDGSAAIQVGGTDVITLTSGGAATFVTSPTTVQAGTAAAPSITTSGDTNTGIFFPAADTIAFTEGGVESVRFDSSGNVSIANGNLVIGTSGKGIDFSATPGTGTSELFDDYEEGFWTPSLTTAGGNFTAITYGDQDGTYTLVGRQVTVRGVLWTSGTVSGGSGQVYIAGLPFSSVSIAVGNVWINPDTGNYFSPTALPTGCYTSGTQLRLFKNGTTNNPSFNSTELTTSGNANYIAVTATYFV